MARVPRIDSPCPLKQAEQLRIDGHCGRCNKHVHSLDGLDDAQRRALFAAAKGPLCVSYRMPVNRAPALGAAMAVMFSASAAMAGQDCDEAKPVYQSVGSAPVEQLVIHDESESERLDYVVVTGGVESAADAAWIDDGSLPDLPVVIESDSGRIVDATAALSAVSKPR
ncbi:MAG: hypothetical protein ABI866_12315 [Dokdonella sp.]